MASKLKAADGEPCPYCERKMERNHLMLRPTRDHVMPQSKGGRDTIIVCFQCNSIKADMLPDQWERFMAATAGWWKLDRRMLSRARRLLAISTPGTEAGRNDRREKKARQGTPPAKPVVVPPELIWTKTARPPWSNPELIAETIAEDARLRTGPTASEEPQPSGSGEACPG